LKQYFAAFIEPLGSAILFPLLWIVVHVRIPGKNFRKPLSTVLIGTGAILIFYVAGSYYSSYRAQRSLMKQWQQANSEDSWSGPALSRISIPKIGLDAVIVEGTNRRSLSKGPGHLLSTVLPGERGNAVIAGHRDTFFRRLSELIPGDDIFIRQGGESYHFVVFRKRVVTPDDISVLRTGSRSILTLITCFPMTYIGPAPQRLIIEAHLAAASQPVI
jgi:sortase A